MEERGTDYVLNVSKPGHYQSNGVEWSEPECIQISRHLSFDMGNAFKYVWRAGEKGDPLKELEDLEKALWYISDQEGNPSSIKSSQAAEEIFKLMKFPDGALPAHKRRALESIVLNNFKSARAGVRDLISFLAFRDFSEADAETKSKMKSVLRPSEYPSFLI